MPAEITIEGIRKVAALMGSGAISIEWRDFIPMPSDLSILLNDGALYRNYIRQGGDWNEERKNI